MISKLFINRPVVAMVIAIVTVIVGLVAMAGLPVAQFPDIVPPQIIVSTTYTGADAQTIEQSVATPLEQQMSGVDDLLYMQSTNANDGTMTLTVTFDVDTNPNIDEVNVQNRVAQAQPNLPAEVNQFGLSMRKSTGIPTLIFALYSPQQTHDSLFLANYANINAWSIKSDVKFAKAQQEFAIVQYQQTIQNAFKEVSDGLIQYQKVREIRAERELLVTKLRERSRLAHLRYEGGVDTLLNALDSDRELFDAE
ncbi:MAG TPA: efflux RND transporter permease subunit, partial [Pyrinomonadaceae bacterium]|nr:efflux RND transporter permease subunit [Pyrinomonadaceae bacterium]